MAKQLKLRYVIGLWMACCLGFGGLLAEQAFTAGCDYHLERDQFNRPIPSSAEGEVHLSIPQDVQYMLTYTTNRMMHGLIHVWTCEQ